MGSIIGLCFRLFWIGVGCGFSGLIIEWVVNFYFFSFVLMQVRSMLWIMGA